MAWEKTTNSERGGKPFVNDGRPAGKGYANQKIREGSGGNMKSKSTGVFHPKSPGLKGR